MNAKDLLKNLDTVSLKDFVENYNDLKSTMSQIQQKVKEIDWKYNFEKLSSEQISEVIQDFQQLINMIK